MSEAKQAKPATVVAAVGALLDSKRASLEALAQKHLNVDRLFKVALNSISSTPGLQKCTPSSLFRAIVSAAELGLEVGGALEHAYLVPYKEKAELVIGYRGCLHLMRGSRGRCATASPTSSTGMTASTSGERSRVMRSIINRNSTIEASRSAPTPSSA